MKILSGAHRPDAGSMTLDGRPYAPRGPREALARRRRHDLPGAGAGAGTLGRGEYPAGPGAGPTAGLMRLREHRRIAAEALELLEHPDIRPEAKVRDLGVGAQQLVEVARALVSQARVIVFDEPTSSLSEKRRRAAVRHHRSAEEPRAGDRLHQPFPRGGPAGRADLHGPPRRPIGRRGGAGRARTCGRSSGTWSAATWASCSPACRTSRARRSWSWTDFRAGTRGRPANLSLRRGEILGLAGLVGAGRTRLIRAVFGLEPVVAGRVRVAHLEGGYATPRRRIEQGLGFLSEDRKGEGLALGRSIEDNMTYPGLRRHAWPRLAAAEASAGPRSRGGSRGSGSRRPARSSRSAGSPAATSRRSPLARLLHQHADVLLLDEPTRGIDVGSKAEIYRLMGELAAQGKAILVVSSYLPELFGICDRIAVMSRGHLTEALPVDRWTEHRVMEVATRAKGRIEAAGSASNHQRGPSRCPSIPPTIGPSHPPGRSLCGGSSAGAGRSSGRSWAWS